MDSFTPKPCRPRSRRRWVATPHICSSQAPVGGQSRKAVICATFWKARRSSRDISISYLAVLQVGFTLWVGYGLALGNAAIVVPNSAAFLVGAATIAVALRYRENAGPGLFHGG